MIVPDVNLLVYAHNPDSPLHGAARRWWEGLLGGAENVGVPWVVATGAAAIWRFSNKTWPSPAAMPTWFPTPTLQLWQWSTTPRCIPAIRISPGSPACAGATRWPIDGGGHPVNPIIRRILILTIHHPPQSAGMGAVVLELATEAGLRHQEQARWKAY